MKRKIAASFLLSSLVAVCAEQEGQRDYKKDYWDQSNGHAVCSFNYHEFGTQTYENIMQNLGKEDPQEPYSLEVLGGTPIIGHYLATSIRHYASYKLNVATALFKLIPENQTVLRSALAVHIGAGFRFCDNTRDAIMCLEHSMHLSPNTQAMKELCKVYIEKGDYEDAMYWHERAVALGFKKFNQEQVDRCYLNYFKDNHDAVKEALKKEAEADTACKKRKRTPRVDEAQSKKLKPNPYEEFHA